MKLCVRITSCCAIFILAMTGGLSADSPQTSYHLPSDSQVIGYLLQSVDWYHHVYAERQVASEPADQLFLDNNRAIEAQVIKLSFEFAKADAAAATAASSPQQSQSAFTSGDTATSDLAHFIELKRRSDQLNQKAIQDVETLNGSLGTARKADRKKLQPALDEAQRRLELLQAVTHTLGDVIDFLQNVGEGQAQARNLNSTIDNLAQSIPELSDPAIPLEKSAVQDATVKTANSWPDTSVVRLVSEVSARKNKLRVVDEKIRLTDELIMATKTLRAPMTGFITQVFRSFASSDLQTSDLALLLQQKSELDGLTLHAKMLSPAVVALDKQKGLLVEYKSHLLSWRTAVAKQHREAWRELLVYLLVVALVVGLLTGLGEISRRLTLRHVHDLNRRLILSLIYRVLTMSAIAVVVLFAIASDFKSLATYFGLLAAGTAVALQNVILASLGYLLLIGKRGIRIGDRIQISAITGDVINMGLLQFQVREFDVLQQRFTGQVATFSNSLVFTSPATGLLKFGSAPENAPNAGAIKNETEPEPNIVSPGRVPLDHGASPESVSA